MRTILIYNFSMNSNPFVSEKREPWVVAMVRRPDVDLNALIANPVRVSSQSIFSGAHEVEIEHRGAVYRLRQTALGKLILTK